METYSRGAGGGGGKEPPNEGVDIELAVGGEGGDGGGAIKSV